MRKAGDVCFAEVSRDSEGMTSSLVMWLQLGATNINLVYSCMVCLSIMLLERQ